MMRFASGAGIGVATSTLPPLPPFTPLRYILSKSVLQGYGVFLCTLCVSEAGAHTYHAHGTPAAHTTQGSVERPFPLWRLREILSNIGVMP